MHPMEVNQISISSQLPSNVPSIRNYQVEEGIHILQDVDHKQEEIGPLTFVLPFSEEAPQVQIEFGQLDIQHTNHIHVHYKPNLDHWVNGVPQPINEVPHCHGHGI